MAPGSYTRKSGGEGGRKTRSESLLMIDVGGENNVVGTTS
jgi:hypothetical protein